MLTVLMLAFGGALALKAFEERQFSDTTTLIQQQREADALAGHVRAELMSSRAKLEGLLLSGASLESIRRGVPFDAVAEREPPTGVWAQLAENDSVRVFAKDPEGRWVSGIKRRAKVIMEPLAGRSFYLVAAGNTPENTRFETVNLERTAVACAPVADAGVAACVSRPAPLFGLGDLNRIVIYGLLIAAPLLAVIGLVGVIGRLQREKAEIEKKIPTQAAVEQASWTAFEVPGVIGLWRWTPKSQLLTVGTEAGALVGAARHGDMSLDEFTSMIADDDRRRVRDAFENPSSSQISAAFQG
ncbi:MAG: hypothetical protein EON61_19255, partial [Alphaproteobacteria bacterium]